MVFHFTAVTLNPFFNLAACCVESVTDGHIDIFVRMVVTVCFVHNDFFAWHADIESDVVEAALGLAFVWGADGHAAADDFVRVLFQHFNFFADTCFHSVRMIGVAKDNLQWRLHLISQVLF